MQTFEKEDILEIKRILSKLPSKDYYTQMMLNLVYDELVKLNKNFITEENDVDYNDYTLEALRKMCDMKDIEHKDLKKEDVINLLRDDEDVDKENN